MNGFDFRTWVNSLSEDELHHLDVAFKFKDNEADPTQPAPVQNVFEKCAYCGNNCLPTIEKALHCINSNNFDDIRPYRDKEDIFTLIDEAFMEDERPMMTSVFKGNIKEILDNAKDRTDAYAALCEYLELEFGIEDLIGFEYDKRRNMTKISYLGS